MVAARLPSPRSTRGTDRRGGKHDWTRLPEMLAEVTGPDRQEIVAASLLLAAPRVDDPKKLPARTSRWPTNRRWCGRPRSKRWRRFSEERISSPWTGMNSVLRSAKPSTGAAGRLRRRVPAGPRRRGGGTEQFPDDGSGCGREGQAGLRRAPCFAVGPAGPLVVALQLGKLLPCAATPRPRPPRSRRRSSSSRTCCCLM